MYAVIETGGKQVKVEAGDTIFVEKLNVEEGETYTFDKVLAVFSEDGVKIGTPYVEGATVAATTLKEGRAKKITVYKYKSKKGYHKKQGHRQYFTKLQINGIQA